MTLARIMSVVFRWVNIGFQWIWPTIASEENHVTPCMHVCLYDRKTPTLSSPYEVWVHHIFWLDIHFNLYFQWFIYVPMVPHHDLQLDRYPVLFVSSTGPMHTVFISMFIFGTCWIWYMYRYIHPLWYISANFKFRMSHQMSHRLSDG